MRPDFKVLVATMMDAGTWHEVRMPQVEMLLVNVAAVRAAQEAINRDGAFLMTDTGELKPHPGSVMISKASSSISTASRLLGLNVNSSEPLAKAAKAESALPAEAKRSAWAVKA
jgi:phage terminase small subunit